jgi:hypothetical protein
MNAHQSPELIPLLTNAITYFQQVEPQEVNGIPTEAYFQYFLFILSELVTKKIEYVEEDDSEVRRLQKLKNTLKKFFYGNNFPDEAVETAATLDSWASSDQETFYVEEMMERRAEMLKAAIRQINQPQAITDKVSQLTEAVLNNYGNWSEPANN